MLRVTFLASDARTLQTVVSGLAAICEQRGAHEDRFTLYHATPVQASKDEAFAVDLIEIHNDEHTAFCSDLQHVVDAVQSSDAASDKDILERCTHAAPRHKPGRYCMLPGRLFPARPSALAFAVRQGCAEPTTGSLSMLCYRVRSPQPSAVLELLSQVGDAARRIAGVLACLSQGIGAHEEDAGLLVVFASDAQVAAFCSDQQARLMSIAANTASDAFDLTYHSGGMGANASKLPERSAAAFVTEVGQRLRS